MGKKFELGQVVFSTCGRDKDRLYLVVGYDGERVLVADGVNRKLDRPKRKNPQHLRGRKLRSEELGEKLAAGSKVTNLDLRGTILELENNTTPSRGGEE